jgi:GT2 family glycosyltransferase
MHISMSLWPYSTVEGVNRWVPTVPVTIAVITRDRPRQLDALLERLAALYGDQPGVGLVVVDNDPGASAKPVVECRRDAFAAHVRYEVEPHPGYSTARNHAVRLVETDYFAFIDDDEIPDAGWLEELLRVQERYAADVVAGRVVQSLPEGASAVITRSGVFEAHVGRQKVTGERMDWCATGNTLVRRAIFEKVGGFDVRFDREGGEDCHIFLRATLEGFTIVWCPDAVVREEASPDRLRSEWHISRARHVGRIQTMLDVELRWSARNLVARAAKFGYQVARGTSLIVVGAARGDAAMGLRGRCALALALGMADGAVAALRRWAFPRR